MVRYILTWKSNNVFFEMWKTRQQAVARQQEILKLKYRPGTGKLIKGFGLLNIEKLDVNNMSRI